MWQTAAVQWWRSLQANGSSGRQTGAAVGLRRRMPAVSEPNRGKPLVSVGARLTRPPSPKRSCPLCGRESQCNRDEPGGEMSACRWVTYDRARGVPDSVARQAAVCAGRLESVDCEAPGRWRWIAPPGVEGAHEEGVATRLETRVALWRATQLVRRSGLLVVALGLLDECAPKARAGADCFELERRLALPARDLLAGDPGVGGQERERRDDGLVGIGRDRARQRPAARTRPAGKLRAEGGRCAQPDCRFGGIARRAARAAVDPVRTAPHRPTPCPSPGDRHGLLGGRDPV